MSRACAICHTIKNNIYQKYERTKDDIQKHAGGGKQEGIATFCFLPQNNNLYRIESDNSENSRNINNIHVLSKHGECNETVIAGFIYNLDKETEHSPYDAHNLEPKGHTSAHATRHKGCGKYHKVTARDGYPHIFTPDPKTYSHSESFKKEGLISYASTSCVPLSIFVLLSSPQQKKTPTI